MKNLNRTIEAPSGAANKLLTVSQEKTRALHYRISTTTGQASPCQKLQGYMPRSSGINYSSENPFQTVILDELYIISY